MQRGPFPPNLKFDDLYRVEISESPRPEAVRQEILDFWNTEQALPSAAKATDREPQVIALARHRASGAIAAVGSVAQTRVSQIHSTVWQFRTYVGAQHRQFELASRLAELVRDHMNAKFVQAGATGQSPQAIGLYIVFESEILHKTNNFAVLPSTQFVFMGPNARGMRQYIFYFNGARVPVRPTRNT